MKGSRELNWKRVPAWWIAVSILTVAFRSPAVMAQGRRSVEEFSAIQQSEVSATGEVSSSRMVLSTMTFAGFALAVWAFGTLLRCRPPLGRDGTAPHPSDLYSRQVVRLVLVFLALGVHDLVCTLFAHDLGSLWEVNPLAARLLAHVSTLVVFKLGLTIGAAVIFLWARSCRLAQVGSWWTAVVYTILIFRWTTYCSVFVVD